MLGAEVPGHHWKQIIQILIVRLQKTPFLTIIHDGIELVTRPVIEENIADGDVFDECVGALDQAMGPDQVDCEWSVVP